MGHRIPDQANEKRSASAVAVERVSRSFGARVAVNEISLTVVPGERVALIGPSGSGKSTLLRLLAGLVVADRGNAAVRVDGRTMQGNGRLAPEARAIRAQVGFVFQQFNLVGRLSVLKNVLIGRLPRVPLWRSALHVFTHAEKRAAMAALARVGVADRAAQRASTLSGGQQQRVAIARAICQEARLLLADEPIASLDPESARVVMDLLTGLTRTEGATLVVSLHQIDFAARYCDRVVALRDGRVCFDGAADELTPSVLRRLYGGGWAELLQKPTTEPASRDRKTPMSTARVPVPVAG